MRIIDGELLELTSQFYRFTEVMLGSSATLFLLKEGGHNSIIILGLGLGPHPPVHIIILAEGIWTAINKT
jgi:hypothetical protein